MTDVAPTRTLYNVRHTLNITEQMDEKLNQILSKRDRSVSMQGLMREALRLYIDDQEDVIGSRRHFSKSLQNRLDQQEGTLVFYLNILIYMLAACLAVLLQVVTRDNKIQSINLIRTAIATALKEGPTLNQQIAAVREELGESS